MTPQDKALQLLSISPNPKITPETIYNNLGDGLNRGLVSLINDADRDIARVETHIVPDGVFYFGFAQNDLKRLYAAMTIDVAQKQAEVMLIVTKGATQATDALFGKSGKHIGNSLLVARLLHLAMFYLRDGGISSLKNDPFDDRLRRIYTQMGFDNGERLDLSVKLGLEQAFDYIGRIYALNGYQLDLPPLPFSHGVPTGKES